MRKNLLFLLCMLLTVFTFSTGIFAADAWDGSVDTSWYKADQTSFEISNGKELAGLAAIVNGNASGITKSNFEGKTITLTADIDLGNKEWTMIGTNNASAFRGTFDGNGKTISNLVLSAGVQNNAFFGYSYGQVKNFTIKSDNLLKTAAHNQAAFVAYNYGIVVNCVNYATINADNCENIGGVAVYNQKGGYIVNCANFGNITSTEYKVGGIVACGFGNSYIYNCYNSGAITGKSTAAGICAQTYTAKVSNCYNAGKITVGSNNIGGIIAYFSGNVASCLANNYSLSSDSINKGVPAVYAETVTDEQVKTVDEAGLKAAASSLGGIFTDDKEGNAAINSGYPIFTYQKTGNYEEESDNLTVESINVANGTITATLNKSLTYTKLAKGDFTVTVAGKEAVANSVTVNGNRATIAFTPIAPETVEKTYNVSLKYKDGEAKTADLTVAAFVMEDFAVENGAITAFVDESLTSDMFSLEDFHVTISANGGEPTPLELAYCDMWDGEFYGEFDMIANKTVATKYTVTLQYKDGQIYSGSFDVSALWLDAIDAFDNPTLAFGRLFNGSEAYTSTPGVLTVSFSDTPVVNPTAADFKATYVAEIDGEFETNDLKITQVQMSGNVAKLSFQRIPLTDTATDIIVRVSYKGGERKSFATVLPANPNWSAYGEKPAVGDGTPESPYQIGTAEELAWFAALTNGKLTDGTPKNLKACAELTADITLNDTAGWESWNKDTEGLRVWEPIGTVDYPRDSNGYKGTFDGRGYTISGLYCSIQSRNGIRGGFVSNLCGTVKNLKIEDSYIYAVVTAGGITGTGYNFTIQNCGTSVILENMVPDWYNGYLGGIAGDGYCQKANGYTTQNCIISGCYSTSEIRGNQSADGKCYGAGIVASIQPEKYYYYIEYSGGTISDCYFNGSITAPVAYGIAQSRTTLAGTLRDEDGNVVKEGNASVWEVLPAPAITNCYNAGTLTATTNAYQITSPYTLPAKSWSAVYRWKGNISDYTRNNYYLGEAGASDDIATAKTAEEMKSSGMASLLGSAYTILDGVNDGYPALKWQGEKPGDLTTVAAPTFTLSGGGFGNEITVAMSTATEGATIFYTTDGSIPGIRNGEEYTEPIPLTDTVKAIAYKNGMYLSAVNTISPSTVVTPVISPNSPYGQTINGKTKVAITCPTKGVTIYYTTDGSDPVTYGEDYNFLNLRAKKYNGKLTVEDPTTVKAVAIAEGMLISTTASEQYDLSWTIMTSEPRQDKEGTYLISSGRELAWFAGLVNGTLEGVAQNPAANAKMTKDIDLGDFVWTPMGDGEAFAGTFDGDGHTIQNMYFGHDNYDSSSGFSGGKTESKGFVNKNSGTIKNLTFTGKDVDLALGSVGIVAVDNSGTISNCHNEVGICTWGSPVAGIVGTNSGTVEFCSNTATIAATKLAYLSANGAVQTNSSSRNVSGIVGVNNNGGIVRDCYNTGNIKVASRPQICGQIVADAKDGSTTERCYALGSIDNAGYRKTHASDWGGWSGGTGVKAGMLAGGIDSATYTSTARVADSYFMQDITIKGEQLNGFNLDNDNFKTRYWKGDGGTGFAGRELAYHAWGMVLKDVDYYVFYDVTNDKYLALELSGEGSGDNVVIDATDETVPHFTAKAGNYLTTYAGEYYIYQIPAATKTVKFINTTELTDFSNEPDLTDFRATAIDSVSVQTMLAQVKQTWPEKYDAIAAAVAYGNPPVKEEEKPVEGKVHVIIENTTFIDASQSADGKTPPPWSGILVDQEVELNENSTMMGAIEAAAEKGDVNGNKVSITGASSGYISGINGLAEFMGKGSQCGWMGTLNDWFTNAGFQNFTAKNGFLRDGDVIRIMYTNADNGGTDIGGAIEGNKNTRLKELSFSNGTLTPAFDGGTTEYTLTLDAGAKETQISYVAANKVFQARTYINKFAPKTWGYKSGDTLTVKAGDKIYIGVGNVNWDSMQQGATETRYTVTVAGSSEPPAPAEFTVTFDSQGGSAVAAQTVKQDGKVTMPDTPTKEGYTFGGWYRDAECETAWTFDLDTVDENMTLYARWIKKEVPVTADSALKDVLSYVQSTVTEAKVGSIKGEWAVIDLARGDVKDQAWYDKYLPNLKAHVAAKDGKLSASKYQYTEYARISLAITAMGMDATAFEASNGKTYDLVAPLLDKGSDGKYYPMYQGHNSVAFALITLDSANYYPEAKTARADYIDSLKADQMKDGLWSITGDVGNVDTTAMVLQALAPYYKSEAKFNALGAKTTYAELQKMVDDALAGLKAKADGNGDYGSSEAADQIAVALCALGKDPQANGWKVIDTILGYRDAATGGFKHTLNGEVNQMATEQAAYTLVAYDRFVKKTNSLYDMTDVFTYKSAVSDAILAIDALPAADKVALTDKDAVAAARKAYDALTKEQQAKVSEELLKKLTDAEAAIKNLEQVAADKAAADAVTEALNKLPAADKVTLTDKKAVEAARAAYDALTEGQQGLVDAAAVKKLTDAEAAIKDLEQVAADKAAADAVTEALNNLPAADKVALTDKAAVEAARAAYDALTDAQKALVDAAALEKLTDAEAALADLAKVNPFTDVAADAYYYEAVLWAYYSHITAGITETTFGPDVNCTRAQVVTFLWRAAGEPKAEISECDFTDVDKDGYYYNAMLWALEEGITTGISETEFAPNATVTRGQVVTFLYRAAGEPVVSGEMAFTDVEAADYYYNAVLWAVEKGVTTGVTTTEFAPKDECTRGQIVTFLYRAR